MTIGDVQRGNAPCHNAGGMPTVETTDATLTQLLTVGMPDKHAGILEVSVVGIQAAGDRMIHVSKHAAYRDGASVTYLGPLAGGAVSGDTYSSYLTGADLGSPTVDATGATVRVQVTGAVAHTVRWFGSARWIVLGQFKT